MTELIDDSRQRARRAEQGLGAGRPLQLAGDRRSYAALLSSTAEVTEVRAVKDEVRIDLSCLQH